MISGQPDNQHAADFVFAGAFDYARPADALDIRVRGVLMADRDDVRGLFAEGIARVRRERVRNNDGLIAPDTEAGKPQPGNIHVYNLAQFSFKGQGKTLLDTS